MVPLLAIAAAWWLTVWVSLPIAFFWSRCSECGCCLCCGGFATEYQIDLAGMANADCTNCGNLNGTYIVTSVEVEQNTSTDCAIRSDQLPTTPVIKPCSVGDCDPNAVIFILFFDKTSGDRRIVVEFICAAGNTMEFFEWVSTLASCIDETADGNGGCLFNGYTMPSPSRFFSPGGSAFPCSAAGTLKLTAL